MTCRDIPHEMDSFNPAFMRLWTSSENARLIFRLLECRRVARKHTKRCGATTARKVCVKMNGDRARFLISGTLMTIRPTRAPMRTLGGVPP